MHEKKLFVKQALRILGIALLVVLPLLGGLFWLRSSVDASVSQIVERRRVELEDKEKLDYLAELKSQDREFAEEYLSLMQRRIPTGDQIIDLPNQIRNLAGRFGDDPSFEFGFSLRNENQPQNANSLGYIGFSANVSADNLDTIIEFAETLQGFKFLTVLDNFNMSQSSGGKVSASITARTFYRSSNVSD